MSSGLADDKVRPMTALPSPHAVALFSGGLDSILAARLILEQGLSVQCLHFVSPFFGNPELIPHWEAIYGLTIRPVDVSEDFVRLLRQRPVYGFGKVMNPCVDCKILMLRRAREIMRELGASFIISGEVLGQRPMSQRRDTLHVICRDADVRDVLLRPLCAQHMPPISAEQSGLVDRARLPGISGRGRREQLNLAKQMGLIEIPTPAGGCKLAERENARRYWPVLTRLAEPLTADFLLANVGRQYWSENHWLVIGRNEADNQLLEPLVRPEDLRLRMADFPGPLGLARQGLKWDEATLRDAASFVASYAPKAVRKGSEVDVLLEGKDFRQSVHVFPLRETPLAWTEPSFEAIREDIRSEITPPVKRRRTSFEEQAVTPPELSKTVQPEEECNAP